MQQPAATGSFDLHMQLTDPALAAVVPFLPLLRPPTIRLCLLCPAVTRPLPHHCLCLPPPTYHHRVVTQLRINIMGAEVGYFHYKHKGVDWVFVDHPSYPRPGGLYADEHGVYGDNQVGATRRPAVAANIRCSCCAADCMLWWQLTFRGPLIVQLQLRGCFVANQQMQKQLGLWLS